MSKCKRCGREIKYITLKKDNKKVSVNPIPTYFVPDIYGDTETFIMSDGKEIQGCRTTDDGRIGYKHHICLKG